jgi:hypothetical protein
VAEDKGMTHVLPVALLALIVWSSVGCETLSSLTEIEPMARRLSAIESEIEGKADRKQVEGKADRKQVQQIADAAQQAGQGALRAGNQAEGAARKAEGAERKAAQVEAAARLSESELRAEISALKKALKSQTATLSALEERLAVVQQANRERHAADLVRPEVGRARSRTAGPSGPPPSAESRKAQERLRTDGVLTQVKAEVAGLAGLGPAQVDHVELAGFLPGSADISPVMEADQRVRAQMEALKRMLGEGRAEVIQIASFEDKEPCRQAAHDCRTIGFRRGLNTASYLGAPKGAVDARPPTDRWGPPAENRRVIVFYIKKDGAPPAPTAGPARPTTPAAAPPGPPAGTTTPTTTRPR